MTWSLGKIRLVGGILSLMAALFVNGLQPAQAAAARSHLTRNIIIEEDAGKTLKLKVGDTRTLKLVENRTIGYNWLPTANGSAVTLGTVHHDGLDTRWGLPGHFTMAITAAHAGKTVVKVQHKSSRTGNISKTLTYTFAVE